MPVTRTNVMPWKMSAPDKSILASGFSVPGSQSSHNGILHEGSFELVMLEPPFVQRQATDGTTHHSLGWSLNWCFVRQDPRCFGQERIAYRYVDRAAWAPMNAGEAGPSVNRREICQPIPDHHVFCAALSVIGTHNASVSGQRQACSSLAGELHIVDHVALPPLLQ
jgi:hypothetical protein